MSFGVDRVAPAKVNLFLHVGPVDADGYHPVATLAVFADIGDRVRARPADRLSLTVEGPFAPELGAADDNLILRALRALGAAIGQDETGLAVTLDKQLPVAAGLGGGSSDAGAALKLAREVLGLAIDDAGLEALAAGIGADGPLCLWTRPALATGRGERLAPAPHLPEMHAVLANPGVASSTAAVYRAYDAGLVGEADAPAMPDRFDTAGVLADWLQSCRNDLAAPAIALSPRIGVCLDAVAAAPGVLLARVSGSGATVFGLCETAAAAAAAARALAERHPAWWIRACRLASD